MVLAIASATGAPSKRNAAAFVLSITALPWLSVKYMPVALTIFLLVAFVKKKTERQFISTYTAVSFVLMAAIYLLFHKFVYQGWTVYSAGDHFIENEFYVIGGDPDLWGRSKRFIGFLVD